MGFTSWQEMSARAELRASIENPNTPLTGKELLKAFGSIETASSIQVSAEGSLSHSAVYACIKVITESIAILPIEIFQWTRATNGDVQGKKPALNHQLWPILHDLPNPEMTAVEVIEALVGHVLLRGNAYCHVQRDRAGRILEIWPLRPDRVWVYRKLGESGEAMPGGDLEFTYTPYAGTPIKFDQSEIWHIKGLSSDGLLGYSPIQLQAEAIGGAIAADKYGNRFFANDARPGGVFTHPGSLSDKAYNRLQQAINDSHRGFDNAHKMMLLEEGTSWQQVGLSPDQAQFLQTREWSLSEMARIFRVSPRLVNDERHPSRLSAEDAAAEDVRQMIMPWTRRFELSIRRDLLNRNTDKDYFARFRLRELLRGNIASRTAYYTSGKANGWLNTNDIRLEEDMNTIGPEGDEFFMAMNMVPLKEAVKPKPEPTPEGADPGAPPTTAKGPANLDPSKGSDNLNTNTKPTGPEARSAERRTSSVSQRLRLRAAYAPLFADAVTRILKREKKDVLAAAAKSFKQRDAGDFDSWLENFYNGSDEHRAFIREAMSGPVKSYVTAISGAAADEIGMDAAPDLTNFANAYVNAYADRHAAFSRTDIKAALAKTDGTDEAKRVALDSLFGEMLDNRPSEVGEYESIRGDGATSRQTYDAGGVTELQWVGGECAFCTQFQGRTVSIHSNFVEPGQSIHSGDASVDDLEVSGSIGHPPLHRGCNCSIEAG
jgi:HK97 family phage portal protein